MTDVLPEVLPDGTAVQQRSPLLLVLALVGALLLGAGSAVVIYALVDDEPVAVLTAPQTAAPLHQTTAAEVTAARAITKDEAATAVAISSVPATIGPGESKLDAHHHALTMRTLGKP